MWRTWKNFVPPTHWISSLADNYSLPVSHWALSHYNFVIVSWLWLTGWLLRSPVFHLPLPIVTTIRCLLCLSLYLLLSAFINSLIFYPLIPQKPLFYVNIFHYLGHKKNIYYSIVKKIQSKLSNLAFTKSVFTKGAAITTGNWSYNLPGSTKVNQKNIRKVFSCRF